MHKKRGVRMIIYATKVLNEKETEEYYIFFLKKNLDIQRDTTY